MKPLINSLYRNIKTEKYFRIIAHCKDSEKVVVISMKEDESGFEWPIMVEPDFIAEGGNIRKCDSDPFISHVEWISSSRREIRDRRFVVAEMLSKVDGIFNSIERNKIIRNNSKYLIKETAAKYCDARWQILDTNLQVSLSCTYKSLKNYWMRGMNVNSVLPAFQKCGAKGKDRNPQLPVGGRQKVISKRVILTKKIRLKMIAAIDKYFTKNRNNSKHDSYIDFQNQFPAPLIAPTKRQYLYRLNIIEKGEAVRRARLGGKKFDKDERQLYGNSRTFAFGPGTEVLIDSTIDNIRILSSYNPSYYIGRLTLYMVVDLATGMLVGFYLTPEPSKCDAAFMALLNTATDKVELAKEFGLELEPNDWPWKFLPGKVLADRGELISNRADIISDNFNMDLSNTQSYHPEQKASIERMIQTFQKKLKGLLTEAGAIGSDDGERGVTDSRKKATLTLKDVTQLLFKEAVFHYHNTWIDNYPLTQEMLADGVEPRPVKLLEWFLSKGYGNMRQYNRKILWQNFLPRIPRYFAHTMPVISVIPCHFQEEIFKGKKVY
ncbi:hypothetical protein BH09BAC3_BH09BAC3_35850 [soil metagenome]